MRKENLPNLILGLSAFLPLFSALFNLPTHFYGVPTIFSMEIYVPVIIALGSIVIIETYKRYKRIDILTIILLSSIIISSLLFYISVFLDIIFPFQNIIGIFLGTIFPAVLGSYFVIKSLIK